MEMDQWTRKMMTLRKAFHLKDNKERFSRKGGARGLASSKYFVDQTIKRVEDYMKKSKEYLNTTASNPISNMIKKNLEQQKLGQNVWKIIECILQATNRCNCLRVRHGLDYEKISPRESRAIWRFPFSLLLHRCVVEGANPFFFFGLFFRLLHFIFVPYLIMLSVRQGGIKYYFLSLWYDSICDWTPVFRDIGKHSNHYAKHKKKSWDSLC